MDQDNEEMKSPPNLGLGTINIVPLHGRTNLTITVWVWNLGMRMGRKVLDTQPVGRLPLIVSYVLILLKARSILHSILTYTLTYINGIISHPR